LKKIKESLEELIYQKKDKSTLDLDSNIQEDYFQKPTSSSNPPIENTSNSSKLRENKKSSDEYIELTAIPYRKTEIAKEHLEGENKETVANTLKTVENLLTKKPNIKEIIEKYLNILVGFHVDPVNSKRMGQSLKLISSIYEKGNKEEKNLIIKELEDLKKRQTEELPKNSITNLISKLQLPSVEKTSSVKNEEDEWL
jgi:hypothetical protein